MRFLCVLPLLLAIFIGCDQGQVNADTEVTTYLKDHSKPFLKHIFQHFDQSISYLFASNAYADKTVEKHGMAKLLREQSDRQWELGISTMKKFFQREGNSNYKGTNGRSFRSLFKIGRSNLPNETSSTPSTGTGADEMIAERYLKQIKTLETDSAATARRLNTMHHQATKEKDASHDDAEMAHFFEEQLEEEMVVMRYFRNLHTNFQKLKSFGLAVHFFDQSI